MVKFLFLLFAMRSVHVAVQVKAQEEQFLHAQAQLDPKRRDFQEKFNFIDPK